MLVKSFAPVSPSSYTTNLGCTSGVVDWSVVSTTCATWHNVVVRERQFKRTRVGSPFDKQPTVPPPEEEASSEQSSCLAATVDAGHLPRFDISVWGSYSHRVAKKVALMGVIITRNGEFRSVETKGPADFSTWLSSWKVLHRAFIT